MEIKKRYLDLLIAGIFLLLLVQFTLLHFRANECLANPFTYGAQKITHEDNNILCSCTIIDPNTPYAPFTFDKDSIEVQRESTGYSRDLFPDP